MQQTPLWAIVALGFAGLNAATYLLFGWDKWRALRRGGRVPERRLLLFAALGGSLGAKAAQRSFRHKIGRHPFARKLNVLLGLQVAGLLALGAWWLSR